MRRIILFTFLALTASLSASTMPTMSGVYKIGNPQRYDVAFHNLGAAILAINEATIEGDIILELTSDVSELENIGLSKDLGSYTLTIRPETDEDRTITFENTSANVGPYGHFVIGCNSINTSLSDATVVPVNNVIIDGYAPGGSTRRLKFVTPDWEIQGSAIFNILGGSSNITIKNCIIHNQSIASSPMGIYILQFKGTTKDLSPSNILIENNVITSRTQTVSGYGIRCNRSGTATSRITGLQIKDNLITASGTGIEVYYCNGVNVANNEIKIQKGTTIGAGIGVWLRGSTGNMYVTGNKFTELVSVQTGTGTYATQGILTGATSANPFNIHIYNNMFSGINRSVTGPANLNQTYIAEIGYGTTNIYNNTFYLPALTLPTQNGAYNAISFTTTSYKANIKNNIFISNEDAKSVLIAKAITSGVSDNNIFQLKAGNTNARVVETYATLADYKTANPTLDVNSKSVNVIFENAAAGNLSLAGTSVWNADLHVPALPEVTTDMFGNARVGTTFAGAHQPDMTTAAEAVLADGNRVLRTSTGIMVELKDRSTVELYNLAGKLIDRASTIGVYSKDISSGAYLIRINGQTVKFIH